jgi:hypothetical protein
MLNNQVAHLVYVMRKKRNKDRSMLTASMWSDA